MIKILDEDHHRKMIILSLFDGMSCAQIAIDKLGIINYTYYASEINKYAIQITQKNYPNTVQLGSIADWRSWDIQKPDLIIAGSPCQGFSFAGKQLNFDDPRSKLFFIFVDILYFYKPKYFLLENVKMRKEYQDIISKNVGVEPVEINSALVSAQNRKRLYWCNWNVEQPKDKGVLLKDIIENGKGFIKSHGTYKKKEDKSQCLDANYFKGADNHGQRTLIQVGTAEIKGFESIKRVYSTDGKCISLQTSSGGNREPKIAIDEIHYRKLTPLECERLQTVPDNYTEGVSNTQRYKMLGNGFTVDVIVHILKEIP